MTVDTTSRNLALDALTAVAARMALHTGDPGAGAANEASGGGYARQDVLWDPASGAISVISGPIQFGSIANPIQATDYSWVSIWNAAGTVRYGKAELYKDGVPEPAVFPVPGVLTITAADLDFSA